MYFEDNDIYKYDEIVSVVRGMHSYYYALIKEDLNLKSRTTPLAKNYFENPSIVELKALASHIFLCSHESQ